MITCLDIMGLSTSIFAASPQIKSPTTREKTHIHLPSGAKFSQLFPAKTHIHPHHSLSFLLPLPSLVFISTSHCSPLLSFTPAMASDSSPAHFNTGPSSPDDSLSTPIPNTHSTPSPSLRRTRTRNRPPSATPPHLHQSRFATSSETTPRPRFRGPATPSSTDDAPPSSDYVSDPYDAEQMYVWGTNISVQDVNGAIVRFLRNFREGAMQLDSLEEGKYMKDLDRVLELNREWIDVDAMDVFQYDPDLYNKMVRYPLEVLAIFEIFLMDMASSRNPLFEKHIQARIFNLKTSTSMRNLNPSG